jgi:predicted PurR-regulated permease PerM
LLALIPIYIFFFLFYREKYKKFIFRITPDDKMKRVNRVIENIQELVQSYLSGVLIVVAVLSVLNSVALLIIGVPYAIVLGILAAVLNIVPYVGVLAGSLIAASIAFITMDSIWYTVAVLASMTFIQFLDNNFITPNITGSKVSINPLAAIIALITGGILWGVPGMILFIPFAGILKAILDSIEELSPYGYLIGTEDTSKHSVSFSGPCQKIKGWFVKDQVQFNDNIDKK